LSEELPDYTSSGDLAEIAETRDADGARQRTERIVGFALRSRDQHHFLQIQTSGFAFSRFAPYETWESFRDRASHAWNRYATLARPEVIRSVAVRYFNRLDLGASLVEDLSTYVNLRPVTPWALTTPPASFYLQVNHPAPDGISMMIGEGIQQSAESGEIAIILDLSATSAAETACDWKVLWNQIERLHVLVEDAFEASITEKMRELIR
jgi:uncharacterized protein (TIGR04255 family)